MIDQFINFVIRPPRAEYNPDQYLWEKDFSLAGMKYIREDIELMNERGHSLRCSHYVPKQFPENVSLPCVVYCHGNSGCRADANEAAVILLPSNITLFTLDFSGSGLSDGDYVSLGWHEKNDLKVVISYLRSHEKVSHIGLWGRSMGAVTSLLYAADDPSISGMVLDSAFSNLFNLMMELADVYKIRLPKFTIKVGIQYMRRIIQKKAKFDIMRLDCMQVASKTFIPALFGHAKDDRFIQPRHSDVIFDSYAGDKNIIKFEGDHNSSRPQFYYDSVSIFFHNVLRPPRLQFTNLTKIEKYYDLGDLNVDTGMDEHLLYQIIAGIRNGSTDSASSSSAPQNISAIKSVGELLSDVAPVASDSLAIEVAELHGIEESPSQDNPRAENEECCSYTSSNRESWGRCSSLGSDGPSIDCTTANNYDQKIIKVLATPLRKSQKSTSTSSKDDLKKKDKASLDIIKKPKRDRFEKLEALSQRLRLCILKKVNHRRHCSS